MDGALNFEPIFGLIPAEIRIVRRLTLRRI